MSELSPGSKTTTNIFMILGGLALLALVIVQNLAVENLEPVNCDSRIIELITPPELAALNSYASATFTLLANGAIEGIEVTGTDTRIAPAVIQSLSAARFTSADDGKNVWCEHQFR